MLFQAAERRLSMKDKIFIALTMGDPSGIGPEVILKGFSKFSKKNYKVIVIGDYAFLKKEAEKNNLSIDFNSVDDFSGTFHQNKLNVLDMKNLPEKTPRGVVDSQSGRASCEYIEKAVDMALQGRVSAITTAPINKKSISMAGFHYAGHTEMLAKLTGAREYAMMLIGGKIRVVLVTTHVALAEVKKMIKKESIFKIISTTDRFLKLFGIKAPHIAVAALNPHAGEGDIFGSEESEEILPAVEMGQAHNIDVTGPYPADSLFVKAKRGEFDAVVVMYHDQGLIPVKMEGFGRGVNVTLGLSIIRTSVDHGTAYDIVGKGIADSGSLIAALDLAAELAKARGMYC